MKITYMTMNEHIKELKERLEKEKRYLLLVDEDYAERCVIPMIQSIEEELKKYEVTV